MKSITRVISLASAVICSCAIATTAYAVPNSIQDLVDNIFIPYTKYENSYKSLKQIDAVVVKAGCRLKEGRVGWELYHPRTNSPCFQDGNITFVGIEGEGKKSSLTLIGSSSSVGYYVKELTPFEKLGQWRNQGIV